MKLWPSNGGTSIDFPWSSCLFAVNIQIWIGMNERLMECIQETMVKTIQEMVWRSGYVSLKNGDASFFLMGRRMTDSGMGYPILRQSQLGGPSPLSSIGQRDSLPHSSTGFREIRSTLLRIWPSIFGSLRWLKVRKNRTPMARCSAARPPYTWPQLPTNCGPWMCC